MQGSEGISLEKSTRGDVAGHPRRRRRGSYKKTAKMGLHQDKDEQNFDWPVLSISLGDTGVFRVGGTSRKDPTEKVELESGDIAILEGDARLAYHGIDRIKFGSSTLLNDGGRINLTLRVVD